MPPGRLLRGIRQVKRWGRRHPVAFVFLVALLVRLGTALVINRLDAIDRFAPDTANYFQLASDKAEGATGSWNVFQRVWYDSFETYLVPLTLLFKVFGPHVFLAQAVTAVSGAGVAALVTALAARVVPRSWVVPTGLVVALFPSQVLWSSLVLRDPAVWLLTAGTGLACFSLAHSHGRRAVVMIGVIALLALLLGNLRMQTLVVLSWALALAGLVMVGRGWIIRMGGLVLVGVIVPWVVGAGPAGIDFVRGRDLATLRVNLAQGADTAIVDATPDANADGSEAGEAGGRSSLGYLGRGLTVMLLEPLPWTSFHGVSVRLAQLEHLLWYPSLLLAGFGTVVAVRRRMTGLAFPFFFGAGILGMYSLAEGNFGTAFRHRGEAVWVVAVLAGVGACHLWRRRSPDADGVVLGERHGQLEPETGNPRTRAIGAVR